MPEAFASIYNTSKAVRTLRAYYRDRTASIDHEALENELIGVSDRASVILGSAMVEDALVYRILLSFKCTLNDEDINKTLRFEGPLGTFSGRTEIAFLFGAIERATYDELNTLREMRNACAHSKFVLNFERSELINVAKRLFRPRGFAPMFSGDATDIKKSFVLEIMFLFYALLEGSRSKAADILKTELRKLVDGQFP